MMFRHFLIKRLCLLAVVSMAFTVGACDDPPPVMPPSIHLSDLTFERLDGGRDHLGALTGKVVVLNVWATWCGPCRLEMPDLDKLGGSILPKERFAVLGISYDDDPEAARQYLRQFGLTFAEYIDLGGKQTKALLTADQLPTTLIFAPDGKAAAKVIGDRDWTSDEWINRVRDFDTKTAAP